jgi:hypothetical protein
VAPLSSIPEPWPPVPGWRPPRLPRRLGIAVEARRALLPDGPGVLVLDGRCAPPAVGAVPSAAPTPPSGGWPAIVTVLALAGRPDLVGSLRQLDAVLAPGGALWLLEPTSAPGMLATLATTLWPPVPARRGLHLGRDVPAAVRAAGFAITDIERCTMPTTHRPLRPFVALRARRAEPAALAGQG